MNTLIIIAAFVLAIYVAVVIATNKQIPNSLSESVYYLPTKGQWLWTAVIAIIALCAIPPFVSKTIHAIQWLAFLACAALAFVAVCPLMGKPGNPDDGNGSYGVHMGAAIACGVLSQICVTVTNPWFLLAWVPWLVAFVWITKDGKWHTAMFWAEMTCFATVFIFGLL